MKRVGLIAVGNPDRAILNHVGAALARALGAKCSVEGRLDAQRAYRPERGQYHSTLLLERLAEDDHIQLGVTELDLFIPILTFVFGEAQLGGSAAVVSYHRLHQEFYGLPRDRALLLDRIAKEAIHETGHVIGLTHCDDYECVMASSHSIEWLDLKGASFCRECQRQL